MGSTARSGLVCVLLAVVPVCLLLLGRSELSGASLLLPVLGLAWMLAIMVLVARALRRGTSVSLDEAGVRVMRRRGGVHIAFAHLADATLSRSIGGEDVLVLVEAGTKRRVRVSLGGAVAADVLAGVLRGIDASRAGGLRGAPSETARALSRGARGFSEWLSELDAMVLPGSTYRSAPFALADAAALLVDLRAPVDVRAAAAYVLAAHGSAEDVATVARAMSAQTPALVVAAAACAPGGMALVGDERLDDALPFLSASEHMHLEGARRAPAPAAARVRVVEALRIAALEDTDDERGERVPAHPSRRSSSIPRQASRAWRGGPDPLVGRTYAR